jgi:hypothetical protein
MAGAKRPRTGGGSRKGCPNKITRELRDMVLGALEDAGGREYLLGCATSQEPRMRAAFLALVGKCLPRDVLLESDSAPLVVIRDYTRGAAFAREASAPE